MKNELIHTLTESFEGYAQQTVNGVEFWLARGLQHLLGYGKWDNFQGVISKAKTAYELSGHGIADHFADVGKMIQLGKGGQNENSVSLINRCIRSVNHPYAEELKKGEHFLISVGKNTLKNPDWLEA
jgi:DNA-damage-inducible protein D